MDFNYEYTQFFIKYKTVFDLITQEYLVAKYLVAKTYFMAERRFTAICE